MRAYTLDRERPVVEALAVAGEWILAAGPADELAAAFPRARRIDLGGRTVLPGLTDSHVHLLAYGLQLRRLDLRETRSLSAAVRMVAAAADAAPPGSWVLGGGWDRNRWTEGRWPTRDDLDPVSAGRPVALASRDGHLLWVNSAALARAGIGPETPDPPGGVIVRDAAGRPTGLLKEQARVAVQAAADRPDPAALRAALQEATAAAHRLGLVGAHSMVRDGPWPEALATLQEARRDGTLRLRVWITIPLDHLERAAALGMRTGLGDHWLRVGGVKIYADGTLGSQTASMLEPYEGQPGNTGIAVHSTEALQELVGRAVAGGLWPTVHAIGDRANREVLDVFAAHHEAARRSGVRFRLEHVQLLHPADLPRLAALGVVASMQPVHCTSDRDIADRYWGARSRTAYAWRSLRQQGTVLAFGSDAPVETLDPWQGLYAAVTRRRPDDPRPPWHPEEAITVEEALRAYTVGAAYASGEEATKGTLTPGRLADFIVVDRDVPEESAADPLALLDTRVLATVVGGTPVYATGPLAGLGSDA
jgi:predicted amidohydrolase YtcJ